MGGRAFENLVRIKREEIPPTLAFLAPELGISEEYMLNNMMGSCGKQVDSGDIDIAMDSTRFSKTDFKNLAANARVAFGHDSVKAMLKNGQINVAVPIPNSEDNVQVDFIYGNAEWLKFSHWSAGEASDWKGVFISQTFGVLAKMKVLYRYPEDAVVDKDNNVDERLGEVAFSYDLEQGLRVRCRLRKRGGFVPVSADVFETECAGPMPPRVPRLGYVDDPATALKMLVGPTATLENTDTFEKLLATLRANRTLTEWVDFTDRLENSLLRSGARYFYEPEDLTKLMRSYDG